MCFTRVTAPGTRSRGGQTTKNDGLPHGDPLKMKLQRKLQNSRATRGREAPESSGGHAVDIGYSHRARLRQIEVRMVDGVKCLRTGLQAVSFREGEDAAQGEVQVELPGAAQHVPPEVA